jgi:hypothetical protein
MQSRDCSVPSVRLLANRRESSLCHQVVYILRLVGGHQPEHRDGIRGREKRASVNLWRAKVLEEVSVRPPNVLP